jgi:HSP20 family molecular chaperone IbpA
MTQSEKQVAKTEETQAQRVERPRRRAVFSPPIDIIETSEEIILRADLPGVEESSIDCTLEAGVLTLRASSRETIPSNMRLIDSEYVPGDFERVFALSEEIDQERIRASVKNGVLDLHLPKSKAAQARKIQISSE